MVFICVSGHLDLRKFLAECSVEGDFKTLVEEADASCQKRLLFVPGDFFETFIAGPLDVRFSNPKVALLVEGEAVVSDAEVGAEEKRNEGTLDETIDFLG